MTYRLWTAAEDEIMRRHVGQIRQLVAKLPGRTKAAVTQRRRMFGQGFVQAPAWTHEEDAVLRRNHTDLVAAHLRLPHRTLFALEARRKKLALPRILFRWSDSETAFVLENRHAGSYAEIASLLPRRTPFEVQRKLVELGATAGTVPAAAALVADIRKRAIATVPINHLARHTGNKDWRERRRRRPISFAKAAVAVEVLGGELYVEWND